MVMLVPPAVPALQGEPVDLRCVLLGGLKLEKAVFYKDSREIKSSPEGTYTITKATQSDNGNYSCRATYRFSHIGSEAEQKEGISDAQELKVIGGPPAAVISASTNSLQCSCPHCPADCTSYHWYHFNDSYTRRRLSENDQFITVEEEGQYRCRRECGKGFSRFSNVYSYTGTHTHSVSLRPKFPQVFVGDDVTLICNREGGSKPTKWFFNKKPQTHQDYSMLLTAVTPENNGAYECEQGGTRSEPYALTVLELEPYAQLSPSAGGAVMTKGDGKNLVLQVDDDLKDWACFVLREVSTFSLGVDVDEKMHRAVIFAELKEAERATFWCKKKKSDLRSNAVTLKKTELMVMLVPPAVPVLQGEPVDLRCVVWGGPKLEKAVFYKDRSEITSSSEGIYTITSATQSDNGKYSCHATYRFSHISAEAAQKEGDSDAQELKVIGGPPAAVISESTNSLQCSCPHCPDDCTSYHWYHFNDPHTRKKLSENNEFITVEEEGQYRCRKECGKGFSRFSNIYSKAQSANVMPILVAVILIFLGLLIVLLVVLKRRRGGSGIQETKRDKDKTTGGDYEQIQLKDKDKAVYHTLGESTSKDQGESTSKDQAEGGYEPLQKRQEEGVYHTVGPGEIQSEGQGGYEALKNVKAEVYQTLSSDDSKKPAGEAEGGYEQLPQKDKDYEAVTMEENPYEEVKKQTGKEKE